MNNKVRASRVAIIGLTRGYNGELDKYKDLIKRNKLIFEKINSKIANPYEVILFHEGNIPEADQLYIIDNSPEKIKFVDVSEVFEKYKNVDGYKIMCKFQMYYLWNYVDEFEYVIRIDEDIFMENFNTNTIEVMKNKKIDFYYSKLSYESHVPTNNSLPEFIKSLYKLKNKNFYNHLFPYTNFYITKTNIWKKEAINSKLKEIAECQDQEKFRWGDLPVLGCILKIEKMKRKRLKKLSYYHSSHNILVKNHIFSHIFDFFNYKRFIYLFPGFFYNLKKVIKLIKS